jgi:hypothetical protein
MVLHHILTKDMRSSGISIPNTSSVLDDKRDERAEGAKKPEFSDSIR